MSAPAGARLLVLGASARALAQSALRSRLARRHFPGGLVALDFFADADLDGEAITLISVARDAGLPRSVAGLGRHALRLDWQAFLGAGGLENRPDFLRSLEQRGRSLGTPAAAVGRVRDPRRLAAWLAARHLPHAPVHAARRVPRENGVFLLKPRRGAGGGGVRRAAAGETVPPGVYLQKYLDGRAGSAAFLADGQTAHLIGVCAQVAGWEALGAPGFRHAGNLFDATAPLTGPERLLDASGVDDARRIAAGLAAQFGLRGMAGFDFIAVGGRPHVIEVNPRWTASMELYDEARPGSLIDAAILVAEGVPPGTAAEESGLGERRPAAGAPPIRARGVLYAIDPIVAPAPGALAALGARDRPRAGEVIAPGKPVCTLTASAATVAVARAAIEAAAARVRALCGAVVSATPAGEPAPGHAPD
jgi:predicted ATP-grasp superfamily ATP-dependent carboligase